MNTKKTCVVRFSHIIFNSELYERNIERVSRAYRIVPSHLVLSNSVSLLSERALTGISARFFDHGARAFPDLHRWLRRLLCNGVGVDLANDDQDGRNREGGGDCIAGGSEAAGTAFEAHAWEEEAPQAQLNGGSDPVVVTASHVVYHGGDIGGISAVGGGEMAAGPTAWMLAFADGNGNTADASAGPGVVGKVASCGVRLRIRVYNATNTRLHGFSIRLSFGQGGEAAGMRNGGKVESAVQEVRDVCSVYVLPVCRDLFVSCAV